MGSGKASREYDAAAGRCIVCGAERVGEGATKLRCAGCSERNRESARRFRARKAADPAAYTPEGRAARRKPSPAARRAARRAAGRCTDCGAAEAAAGQVRCAGCLARQRGYQAAYRRRARLARPTFWTAGRGGDPLPFGGALPRLEGPWRQVTFHLDFQTVKVITNELRVLDTARREAAAEAGAAGTGGAAAARVERHFQLSRILREAILGFEAPYWRVPLRRPSFRLDIEQQFTFRVDARTMAVIAREAARRDGNQSAAVCDLLVYAADRARLPRDVHLGRGGLRGTRVLQPGYDPDWDD